MNTAAAEWDRGFTRYYNGHECSGTAIEREGWMAAYEHYGGDEPPPIYDYAEPYIEVFPANPYIKALNDE